MKQNNTEKKSLKERIAENKGKIMTGTLVIGLGAVSYMAYKNNKQIKQFEKLMTKQLEFNILSDKVSELQGECLNKIAEQTKITKEIAKEGALEEAINTVKRKIQYRVGKIADLNLRPDDKDAMLSKEIYERELEVLKAKLKIFENEWSNMIH